MFTDKHPSVFPRQMKAIVFVNLQAFFVTRAVLKIGEYPRIFPSFSWGIFGHVTRLDQSRASENIPHSPSLKLPTSWVKGLRTFRFQSITKLVFLKL